METDSLTYRCPYCGTLVDVTEGVMGDMIVCPNQDCRKPFRADIPSAMPARETPQSAKTPHARVDQPASDEEVIRRVHPAMFRSHPLRYVLLCLFFVAGLAGLEVSLLEGKGLVLGNGQMVDRSMVVTVSAILAGSAALLFAGWWIGVLTTTLTVTSERTRLRRGIIARHTTEVRHCDVRNLQVEQNILQRLWGVGDVAISSSGQDNLEIVVHAVPKPQEIASIVRDRQ